MTRPSNTQSPPSSRTQSAKLQLPASCDPPGPANPPRQRVWVIFGGSGHIGRSVLKAALTHGDIVTAVGKLHEDTLESMATLVSAPSIKLGTAYLHQRSPSYSEPSPAGNVRHQHPHPCYLPLLCDVRLPASVAAVFQAVLERWGDYDVVANCSGYGVIGACEDQDDAEIRGQLETNFFGTLYIIQASLPYFRTRGRRPGGEDDDDDDSISDGDSSNDEVLDDDTGEDSSTLPASDTSPGRSSGARKPPRGGRYLIFSSTSGALGVPGLGPYCATKYAVEGLIESLLYEVDPFGIRASLVEPGYVRRDDNMNDDDQTSNASAASGGRHDPDKAAAPAGGGSPAALLPTFGHFFIKPASRPYARQNAPAAHARRVVQWLGDHQPTSAVKAAELVWQLGHCRFPPLRLLLGSYAVESVRDRLRTITEEIEDWKFLNFGAQSGTGPGSGKDEALGKGGDGDGDGDGDEEMEDEGGLADESDEGDDAEMGDAGDDVRELEPA